MFFAMESSIFGQWLSPDETCLGMYDCVLLISGYWAMWWRRSTERVRTVSLSRFTSVLASFGTQYLWCCLFYSLVAKDCQYPRDPMQPAIKKKTIDLVLPCRCKRPGRAKKRLYGAAIISGIYATNSMLTLPLVCKSHTSSHPMTTYVICGFNGIIIPSCCSLIHRWLRHCLWNIFANRPAT